MVDKKYIRIGNQTAFSSPQGRLPFDFAINNGFDAFEWFSDKKSWGQGWDIEDATRQDRQLIKEQSTRHNIALSVHVPAEANPLFDNFSDIFNKHVEFACDVGASNINIHLFTEHGIESYMKSLIPLINITANARIQLSIENTTITGPDDFNRLFSMLPIQNARHVGMCLDIGHANIFHETRNDFLRYIDRLDVPIVHIHAHENFGDRDSHMTLFTGPSQSNSLGLRGFSSIMKNRSFNGMIIMEQWPSPPELLINARLGLLDFFGVQ
ncbi:sugar phosphate isomerase/epimerase family protein [Candidatus Magnetominusculus xianensis]|nr:sugar phosphate isomerase/epimerase family protein [Candidatus Magnetominusculus xianensis]MBF0403734.1 TIM barrel protein [Nitrospirota bacterium]